MKRYLGSLLLVSGAFAADRPLAAEPPPERIVRASFVGGDASYLRGDADDWSALGANTPLMTGDSLYTADDARAEVSLGRGSFARLSGGTQLALVNLTGGVTQLGMESGRLSLRVRSVPEGGVYEVDTPSATATLTSPGLYRVWADPRGAMYEVVTGGMSVVVNGEQLDVGPGESLALEGFDPPTYEYAGLRPAEGFDEWANERDRRFERSGSARHVHPEVEGHEDLDSQGSWRPHSIYGRIWIPAGVGPDWAPYQDGRWVWQDPYGWTWVSYEPWGWAPYHYGRWISIGGTWAWVPPPPRGFVAARGVIMPQPVYAPALVAFVGGSNWSIGISVGGGSALGWVPLAPADPYYYPWQPTPTRVVNYRNVTVVNAVTVVHVNNFVAGGGSRIKVPRHAISRAPVMGCSPRGIDPTPASLVAYPGRRLRPGTVPVRAGHRRPLVARLVPPPRPVTFKEKAEVIRKTGRPVQRPVVADGDVGKPYHKGARVPHGVNVVSAIAPERPAKPLARRGAARGEAHGRSPRRIDHDLLPDHQRSEGRPAPGPESPRGGWQKGHKEEVAPGGTPAQPDPESQRAWGRGPRPEEPTTPPPDVGQEGPAKPGEREAAVPGESPEQQKPGPPRAWRRGPTPSDSAAPPAGGEAAGSAKPGESAPGPPGARPEQSKSGPPRWAPRAKGPAGPATPPASGDKRGGAKPGETGAPPPGGPPDQGKGVPPQANPHVQQATVTGGQPGQGQAKAKKGKKGVESDKKKKEGEKPENKDSAGGP